MNKENFIIIGRRGSGKTALSEFFKFQTEIPKMKVITINQNEIFDEIINQAKVTFDGPESLVMPKLQKLWELEVWKQIFKEFNDKDIRITNAYLDTARDSNKFACAKEAIFEIALRIPIMITIDTLEKIDTADTHMMRSLASLIEYSEGFCRQNSRRQIFIKIFVSAEVFPHLKEIFILNPLKSLRDEVYLHWRPKDLLRLISWRFYQYLQFHKFSFTDDKLHINWQNYEDILSNVWLPFWGSEIANGKNLIESTFPYVLRHTQMRPRQLIFLCDKIAKRSFQGQQFPKFYGSDIIAGLKEGEVDLATEVINSYSTIYPQVAQILDALGGIPSIFDAKELDRRAHQTAGRWETGRYSPSSFRQLVSELGIVGRVRTKNNDNRGIVTADFEYFSKDRLGLISSDECVIHPMFYSKFKVSRNANIIVYPFPDQPDFAEMKYC